MSPNNHLSFSESFMLSVHEAIQISYLYHLPCQGSRNCQKSDVSNHSFVDMVRQGCTKWRTWRTSPPQADFDRAKKWFQNQAEQTFSPARLINKSSNTWWKIRCHAICVTSDHGANIYFYVWSLPKRFSVNFEVSLWLFNSTINLEQKLLHNT